MHKRDLTKSKVFVIKTLSRLGIEGNSLNLTWNIRNNPTAGTLNGDKPKAPRQSGAQRAQPPLTSFSAVHGGRRGCWLQRETELPSFTDDTTVYTGNPKEG